MLSPSQSRSAEAPARAIYGLRLSGLGDHPALPLANGEPWPEVRVVRRIAPRKSVRRGFGGRRACFEFAEGRLLLERAKATITTVSEEPLPADQLVHPWLATAAGMWARWLGRDVFHGGAIALDGGAWAVLGARERGKSTLLAALALDGHAIVADDALVLEGEYVFAGPRCVDVRPDAAAVLAPAGPVAARGGSRRRLTLGAVPSRLPLRGIVHLTWGDEVALERVPLPERIERLREHNAFHSLPALESTLLELAALPTVELRRPRTLDRLSESAAALVDGLGHAGRRISSA
jgi:hypothetical protein